MFVMANRNTASMTEWEFTTQEVELFRGAYSMDFGSLAHAALLKRGIKQRQVAARFQRNVLHLRDDEKPAYVRLPHEVVQNVIAELEIEGTIYDNPERFPNGEQLLDLVDDCKNLMIQEDA